mmetsp:Transcript_1793/g.10989  ORF Transcript_1793/g.10989 Transcript_1793/m.10989 type:complete len:318 (-) Transcript_1793:115-1068(-)
MQARGGPHLVQLVHLQLNARLDTREGHPLRSRACYFTRRDVPWQDSVFRSWFQRWWQTGVQSSMLSIFSIAFASIGQLGFLGRISHHHPSWSVSRFGPEGLLSCLDGLLGILASLRFRAGKAHQPATFSCHERSRWYFFDFQNFQSRYHDFVCVGEDLDVFLGSEVIERHFPRRIPGRHQFARFGVVAHHGELPANLGEHVASHLFEHGGEELRFANMEDAIAGRRAACESGLSVPFPSHHLIEFVPQVGHVFHMSLHDAEHPSCDGVGELARSFGFVIHDESTSHQSDRRSGSVSRRLFPRFPQQLGHARGSFSWS